PTDDIALGGVGHSVSIGAYAAAGFGHLDAVIVPQRGPVHVHADPVAGRHVRALEHDAAVAIATDDVPLGGVEGVVRPVGADDVTRGGLEEDGIDIGDRTRAGGISADVVARDFVVVRAQDKHADIVTADHISLGGVAGAIAVGADEVARGPAG